MVSRGRKCKQCCFKVLVFVGVIVGLELATRSLLSVYFKHDKPSVPPSRHVDNDLFYQPTNGINHEDDMARNNNYEDSFTTYGLDRAGLLSLSDSDSNEEQSNSTHFHMEAFYTDSELTEEKDMATSLKPQNQDMNGSKTIDSRAANSTYSNCSDELKASQLLTSRFVGGTGNQIFQLCVLVASAEDACRTPVVRPNSISRLTSIFRIQNIKFTQFQESNFTDIHDNGRSMGFVGPIAESLSPGFNWRITGYRQSYKYFQYKKELVRSTFVFKEEIRFDVSNFFNNFSLSRMTKVGVHVRRGNFANEKAIATGFVPGSTEYIHRAISYFNDHFASDESLVFVIVSDDMAWCRDNINLPNAYFSPFNDAGRDLFMLTQCDHNIVTAGTFGWMGAWLNETGSVTYDKSFPRFNTTLWQRFTHGDYYPDWWIGL